MSVVVPDFLKVVQEDEAGFKAMAEQLFHHYAIQTHDTLYRLCEIEFYWNAPGHIDNSTYKRKHVDPKSGDWFFHYSGVDIALRDEATGGYGGILIRSVYDVAKQVYIKGPMVCAMKLFSATSAFAPSIKTHIIAHEFPPASIQTRPRIGLSAQENGADQWNYAFWIDCKPGSL